ncbi:hypothetical protein GQ43DRAFT_375364 [Delitschia confertaspora ATCC 74209]|uniref:Haloacid dehalogenase-like hydrolase n=1 Tax=Delitschia confertaspora ATCC 74209 TaxID=1513339 RepID=A0A9P4JIH8_9PLEO|nr:hypothetical protein GQ43DRAFT_375364 [Delitschia confertaspora ATCC 74209]
MASPISQFFSGKAIHVILDWDGTLTRKDTIETLVKIAISSKEAKDPTEAVQLRSDWEEIKRLYSVEYVKSLEEAQCQAYGEKGSILRERLLLSHMKGAEERSVKRVSDSGIFEGLTMQDMAQGAAQAVQNGDVKMREGWVEFFELLKARFKGQYDEVDQVDLISVNWSREFICKCFEALRSPMLGISLHTDAMDLIWDQPYGTTRRVILSNSVSKRDYRLHTSSDKLHYFQQLRRTSPLTMKPMPLIYIGDSSTDFECLLAADLGICIRDHLMNSTQQGLAETLDRVGIPCPHIFELEQLTEWNVAWARDFTEITEFFGAVIGLPATTTAGKKRGRMAEE